MLIWTNIFFINTFLLLSIFFDVLFCLENVLNLIHEFLYHNFKKKKNLLSFLIIIKFDSSSRRNSLLFLFQKEALRRENVNKVQ